jgi:N-acetylglucosaminyldiphosphoundecaprenol N-acetyl-beta-D-mannosaminyltransferase
MILLMSSPVAARAWNLPADGLDTSSAPAGYEEAYLAKTASVSPGSTSRPPLAMLGVPIDNLTTDEAIQKIIEMVDSRRPHYVVTANVDFLVQAQTDVELRRILFDAHLVLCDGTPLVWASRMLGNPLAERVAGADVVPLLIRVAVQRKYRIFLLGATPQSAQQAVTNLRQQHEGLIIAGHYSPPFRKLLEMDHDEIKKRILAAQPDLLFVSFGCPKQEKWIAMHYRALGVPVAAGVGATIDFLAGHMKRAPVWMQRSGLEWVFRLAQEPRRLFGRYMKDLWVFGRGIFKQWWQLQFRLQRNGLEAPRQILKEPVLTDCDRIPQSKAFEPARFKRLSLSGRLDLSAIERGVLPMDAILSDPRDCLAFMAGVEFIDSTGMGRLIELHKKLHALNRTLVLVEVSGIVQQGLKLMRMEEFFVTAPNQQAAEEFLQSRDKENPSRMDDLRPSLAESLVWQGEITAVNAEEVWNLARSRLMKAAEESQPEVVIDLSLLRFIDSSGLGVMVRIKKLARHHGTKLVFKNPPPAVLNVVQISRLEEFLLGRTQFGRRK